MKKILVVEDEVPLLKILVQSLKESSDFEVYTASDGLIALEVIRKEKPDLVILDIVMPKLNGLGVLEKLRFKDKNNVQVIVLSNLDKPEDKSTIEKYKVADYIIKSQVSLTRLVQIINAVLTDEKLVKVA